VSAVVKPPTPGHAFFSDPVVRIGIPGVEYFARPWVLGLHHFVLAYK